MQYHQPVLLNKCLEGLNIKKNGVYVDATFGGGGHSSEILKHLGNNGKLFAFDQDEDAAANAPDDKRLIFIRHNFKYMANFLKYHQIESVNGILADLGVSSHHFDTPERGFSFGFEDSALDMRMNKDQDIDATYLINKTTEDQLSDILKKYGDIKNAKRIASAITESRKNKKITTTGQLTSILEPFIPKQRRNKFLAKVFQALRIEVNDEINSLQAFINQTKNWLEKDGRLVIISYHALEDRLVKNFIRSGNFEGKIEKDFYGNEIRPFEPVNTKVIVPDQDELIKNPRARSAKLRIAKKN